MVFGYINELRILVKFKAFVHFKGRSWLEEFRVAGNGSRTLLSVNASVSLEIITFPVCITPDRTSTAMMEVLNVDLPVESVKNSLM
jgi:hypothetical protein